ncbi:Helicase conserved C-terminal domain-containing protein [Ruminococcus sp. YRD2003]|nr:Helicase conserved C-terminal domain-containing protein [Ruminococcus flavefaciens]
MSMNPRQTTEKIRTDYQNYIASILSVKDPVITKLAHEAVRNTEFVKGPFLETTLPFVEGKSLKALADEGLISREFSVMGKSVHYEDWKLRIHQENALRHIITKQRNMVVSTGTGSGKTECYLYPIINSLMREKEEGTLDAGVRALLIFPMNALANDQQKKLRKLLRDYPDITFGRYTGETAHAIKTNKNGKEESPEEAETRLHKEYDEAHISDIDEAQRKSIPNELMCREMMAAKPPHILLTNYAMLEYMLLRPDTAPFFDNSSAKNWQFIVIDEAHTYKGANGTEIAYLLRRVKERIRHNMHKPFRCIATSATLGSNDGKKGLALFAQNLFDEPFSEDDIITTKRIKRTVPKDAKLFSPNDYTALKKRVSEMNEVQKGAFLYNVLSSDLRLFRVYSALESKPKKLEDVAGNVFDDIPSERERENALIDLIELAAAAKKSEFEYALLPARYHLFVKSLEGMFARFYPKKEVYLDRKEQVRNDDQVCSVFELADCQKCQQEYLVGKVVTREYGDYFVQTSNAEKPEYLFISNDSTIDFNGFDEDDSFEEKDKLKELEKYHLCLCCGRLTPFAEKHILDCCENNDPEKIVLVYNLKYSGKDSESNCCPCCGATKKGLIKRFLTANQPATFTIAKSLYDAIPPRPLTNDTKNAVFDDPFEDDPFADDGASTPAVQLDDETGRKLLIFSDNRQEAAFFAGFFEKKYHLVMWRKVILQCLREADEKKISFKDLISRVTNKADKTGLYSFDIERQANMTYYQKREQAALYIMQEYLNPDIDTGIEGLGYISIEPEPITFKPNIVKAGLSGNDLWNLIRFMMDTLRQKGASSYPDTLRATNDFFAPRNHSGCFRESHSLITSDAYIYGFIPKDNSNNKRLSFMLKLLEDQPLTEDEKKRQAIKELKEIYELMLLMTRKGYLIELNDKINGRMYQLNHEKWYFRYIEPHDKLYRCTKCRKVYSYSIKGKCQMMKCNGTLEEVEASIIQNAPYYSDLFADDKFIPMVAREHTAQLSAETASQYQRDFEAGKINVLSCSTTFEMGVDVGELEATFQRNVPPETANYIQRAGRAGRRTSSAAFSVTFSRRTSHDMTFYHDPVQIIAGRIKPPVLETNNEKIAERHMNSIIVAWFFKRYPDYFTKNTKRIISCNEEKNMADELKAALSDKPQELLESIHNAIPADVCRTLGVDDWKFIDNISGDDGSLTKAISERKANIEELKRFSDDADKYGAIAADKLIETLEEERSINFLSSKGVLPKYGFPIDTVSLDIIGGTEEEARKIDLSRDLKIAISEFAPPAKIVANGKIWESYAINTVPDKGWPTYVYHECPNCKRISPPDRNMIYVTADIDESSKRICRYCDTVMNPKKFIIPLFGFSTQIEYKPKPVGETKPARYYATQTQFWGIDDLTEKQKAEAMEKDMSFKGKAAHITYSPGGKLFVLNQGMNGRGLRVCPTCGYTIDPTTPLKGNEHITKYKKKCKSKNLINVSLGHEFSTDIIKIALPSHEVSLAGTQDKNQDMSVLYAILEGASKALDISRDDISGCVTESRELVLFDDTSGGSGFVKYIYNNFDAVLREALNKVSGMCGCTEETSCYGCLRNYSNQHFHDMISRGLAKEYISWLLYAETDNVKNAEEKGISAKTSEVPEEIGIKTFSYEPEDTSANPDTLTQLEALRDDTDDESIKRGLEKLIAAAADGNFENPITDSKLPTSEKDIWPELFWGRSRVALFTPGTENQYKILKKYNWYCYMIGENINAELVMSHIRKEE